MATPVPLTIGVPVYNGEPYLAEALDSLLSQDFTDFRVVVAGPTTLAALINSLQMGFRTLAIQKRSAEVWKLLGAVKLEFGKFGEILDKVHKQLQTATRTIDTASRKTRTIERKLRRVEDLPVDEAHEMLRLDADEGEYAGQTDAQAPLPEEV